MLDVAIIGGGPAGSTAGSLLKKYSPGLHVGVFEKEVFPREHVGESQLPPISRILDEMGCWNKVEAANFPIKIGATYRWGASPDLWDFFFVKSGNFEGETRPGRYEGERLQTAFQVDRSRYDEILLDHAAELGCEVHQGVAVSKVLKSGDRVSGLELSNGETVSAKHYLDASGNAAIVRKAMGVKVSEPAALRNIAIWDYWENAEWAQNIGVGGTMVQIMSIGSGWIWFIPISPTRTSIGFICPAEFYKSSGKSTEELYLEALPQDERVSSLIQNAKREGKLQATKDWSFLSERMSGGNWFLIGETAGFADPILAAGMTLAQSSAREAAYIILELERGEHSPKWLKNHYDQTQSQRIQQHIRFADFWYAANGQFSDLQEHTSKIAADAGLELSPEEAFQWLGTGGFTDDVLGQVVLGGHDLGAVKQITGLFTGGQLDWNLNHYNVFELNLEGASQKPLPLFKGGRIEISKCLIKGDRKLPLAGMFQLLFLILQKHSDIQSILTELTQLFRQQNINATPELAMMHALQPLEIMISEGWVSCRMDPAKPRLKLNSPQYGEIIRKH